MLRTKRLFKVFVGTIVRDMPTSNKVICLVLLVFAAILTIDLALSV
jgi:hypothetical protein